jgi:hypothetical protein
MKAKSIIFGIIIIIIGIQFIPVERTNPEIKSEPEWYDEQTKVLAQRACFDCHSNETTWPWYSKIAPVSWLVAHDVNEGREHFNMSEYYPGADDADEAASELEAGRMPLNIYEWMHPEAKLTDEEKEILLRGLELTFGTSQEEYKRSKFSH